MRVWKSDAESIYVYNDSCSLVADGKTRKNNHVVRLIPRQRCPLGLAFLGSRGQIEEMNKHSYDFNFSISCNENLLFTNS